MVNPRKTTQTPTRVVPIPGSNKVAISSKEKQHYIRYAIRPDDIKGTETVNLANLTRLLTLGQDNINDSTEPSRSNPLGTVCIVESVKMTAGQAVVIKHTLRAPWRYAYVIGGVVIPPNTFAQSNVLTDIGIPSNPLTASLNQKFPRDSYCVVVSSGSGLYHVLIASG